jgi:hypothetical protein
MMEHFTERHAAKISGELSCLDRVVISGTIPGICYADGMSDYLRVKGIRIFDYAHWAEPLRDQIRQNTQALAEQAGLSIEHLRNSNVRKEGLVREVLKNRGAHEGLVCIFSAMEACPSYKPWQDKVSGRTFLKGDTGKCLHYYFYFIDRDLGLCYVRVPTWAPFRLQVYFNGHGMLEATLRNRRLTPGCWITVLCRWLTGRRPRGWPTISSLRGCTQAGPLRTAVLSAGGTF